MADPTYEDILDIFNKCNQLEALGVELAPLERIRTWAAEAVLSMDRTGPGHGPPLGEHIDFGPVEQFELGTPVATRAWIHSTSGESGRSLSAMDAREELDSYAQRVIADSEEDRTA